MLRVIKEGNPNKQGNAACPKCDKRVLIKNYYGDRPKCSSCGGPLKVLRPKVRFMG